MQMARAIGILQTRCDCSSVSVLVISPPQEGNGLPLRPGANMMQPPRQAAPATPPEEGN